MNRLFCSTTSAIPIKFYSFETIITFLNGLVQIVKILLHRRQASIYPIVWFLNNMTWPCKEYVTDYVEYGGPCLPQGRFSKICTISVSQNRKKYIYIYMFPVSNWKSKHIRNHTIDLYYHIHHLISFPNTFIIIIIINFVIIMNISKLRKCSTLR